MPARQKRKKVIASGPGKTPMQPSAAKPALDDIAHHVTSDRVRVFTWRFGGVAKTCMYKKASR